MQQSFDRTHDLVRDVESYFAVRRGTAGVKPVITVNQSKFSLPDHVVDHGVIQRLELITTDLVIVSNDLYSYNVEFVYTYLSGLLSAEGNVLLTSWSIGRAVVMMGTIW